MRSKQRAIGAAHIVMYLTLDTPRRMATAARKPILRKLLCCTDFLVSVRLVDYHIPFPLTHSDCSYTNILIPDELSYNVYVFSRHLMFQL